MSKLFYKAIIHDIENKNCLDAEVENLLDTFEYAMKHTARTLARKAWFELADFGTAGQRGIAGFSLTLEKQMVGKHEQWTGVFTHKNKELKVLGGLERD
jgi:hypothetical protein